MVEDLHIVEHPTRGTQAFHCPAAAEHYAEGQPVRHWHWRPAEGWVEGTRVKPLRGRRR